MFRAGIQNEALYGSEVAVLSTNLVASLRAAAAAAGCWLGRGLPVPLRMLALGVALDPGFDHYFRTIETWAREIWIYFHGKDARPSDLLRTSRNGSNYTSYEMLPSLKEHPTFLLPYNMLQLKWDGHGSVPLTSNRLLMVY